MRRALFVILACAAFAAPAAAQEIGVDGGLNLNVTSGDDVTSLTVPSSGLRIGFPSGESAFFETLVSFAWVHATSTSTALTATPGVVIPFARPGQPGFYVRPEAGLLLARASGSTATQLALGVAAGVRSPVRDAIMGRLEVGVDRWLEHASDGLGAYSAIRIVAGLSMILN